MVLIVLGKKDFKGNSATDGSLDAVTCSSPCLLACLQALYSIQHSISIGHGIGLWYLSLCWLGRVCLVHPCGLLSSMKLFVDMLFQCPWGVTLRYILNLCFFLPACENVVMMVLHLQFLQILRLAPIWLHWHEMVLVYGLPLGGCWTVLHGRIVLLHVFLGGQGQLHLHSWLRDTLLYLHQVESGHTSPF